MDLMVEEKKHLNQKIVDLEVWLDIDSNSWCE